MVFQDNNSISREEYWEDYSTAEKGTKTQSTIEG
jgi:hypothetical protein